MIRNKTYILPTNTSLSNTVLKRYIKSFWNDIFSTLQNKMNIHLMVLVKVHFINGDYRTLADLRKLNYNDMDIFISFLVNRLGILNESYQVTPVTDLTFTYIIKDGIANDEREIVNQEIYEVTTHSYNNYTLPLTMNPDEYGEIFQKSNKSGKDIYTVTNGNRTYLIESTDTTNTVQIPKPIDLKWVDTKINETLFKREIGKNIIYINNGKILVKEKELSAKPFKKVNSDKVIAGLDTFMTLDIETILVDNVITPYLICGYGKDVKFDCFINELSDKSIEKMFNNFITKLIEIKQKNKSLKYIYAHNFSGFDGILLLKHLVKYKNSKVKPLIFISFFFYK